MYVNIKASYIAKQAAEIHACQVKNVLLLVLHRREEKKERKERERERGAYEKHRVWILSLIRYQMNNSTSKSYTHVHPTH